MQELHQQDQEKLKQNPKTDSDSSDDQQDNNVNDRGYQSEEILSKYRLTSIQNVQNYFGLLFPPKIASEICKEKQSTQKKPKPNPDAWKFCAQKILQKIKFTCKDNQANPDDPFNQELANFISEGYLQPYTSLLQTLMNSKRFKRVKKFSPQLIIHKVYPSKHHQIVNLDVQLLWYQIKICILNVPKPFSLKKIAKATASGTFGSVYLFKFDQQQIAIKLIPLSQKNQIFDQKVDKYIRNLTQIIKEYFFLLLFSQLQIAPQAKTIGGFDLIVYDDSIIFGTQVCKQVSSQQKNIQKLGQSLMKMHTLRVVHRDIKPMNIMYSPSFKKNVFIDFGCSQAFVQQLGQKQFTRAVGTPAFCCQEVLKLSQTERGYVDLYFNDAYGLAKSVDIIFTNKNLPNNIQLNEFKTNYFVIFQLKHHLYHENYADFLNLWNQLKKKSDHEYEIIQIEILQFMPQISISVDYDLKKFYLVQIQQNVRSRKEFGDLAKLYDIGNSGIFYQIMNFPLKQKQFSFFSFAYRLLGSKYTSDLQQNLIKQIIQNPTLTKKFIQSRKHEFRQNKFLAKPMAHTIYTIQTQNQNQQLIKKICFACIIFANYCSMSQNKYGATLEEKIQAVTFVMGIIRISFIFQNLIDKQMNLLAKFYQIYAIKVGQLMPFELKSSQMVNCISNLCILGYPMKAPQDMQYFLKGFFTLPQQKQKQLIQSDFSLYVTQRAIIILKINLLYVLFANNTMHYNRNRFRFVFPQNDFLAYTNSIMLTMLLKNQDFLKLIDPICFQLVDQCVRINKYIWQDKQNSIQEIFTQHSQNLIKIKTLFKPYQQAIYQQNSKWHFYFNELWLLMALDLCNFCNNFHIDGVKHFINHIKQYFTSQFFSSNQLLYYHAYNFLFDQSNNPEPLILDKADQIINCTRISIRFKLQRRFALALNKKDFKIVTKIMEIFKQDFEGVDIHEDFIGTVQLMMENLWLSLIMHLNVSPALTYQFASFLIHVYPFFNLMLGIGYQYANQLPRPNYIYSINAQTINEDELQTLFYRLRQTCDFYFCLSKVVDFFVKMFPSIKSEVNTQNWIDFFAEQKMEIKSQKKQVSQAHQFYLNFKQEHFDFIKKMQKESIVFDYLNKLVKFIKQNKQAIFYVKKSKKLFLMLFQMHHSSRNKVGFTQKFLQFFVQICESEQQIKQVETQKNEQQIKQVKTQTIQNFVLLFQNLSQKILDSNFDVYLCDQMVQLYKLAKSKNRLLIVYRQEYLLACLLFSFVYTCRPYHEVLQLMLDLTNLFNLQYNYQVFYYFANLLNQFFNPSCDYIPLPNFPEKWDLDQLSNTIQQSLEYVKPQKQPYMALIYMECIFVKPKQDNSLKKFTIFTLKALQFLPNFSKRLLFKNICKCCYFAFQLEKRKRILEQRGIHQNELFSISFPKSEQNQSIHRKLLYSFRKYHKFYCFQYKQIPQFLYTMFVKQRYFKNYEIPLKFKILYLKKLDKFIRVSQNYLSSETVKNCRQFMITNMVSPQFKSWNKKI